MSNHDDTERRMGILMIAETLHVIGEMLGLL